MPKIWDTYDYRIAEHYLPALINDDESGMTVDESRDLAEWSAAAYSDARASGWNVGHWSTVDDSGENWGRCAVSGLYAMRCTVQLCVYREGATE